MRVKIKSNYATNFKEDIMFQIISDGGCDFSAEEAREFNVKIVPFYVTFDQATHLKEGIDISKEEYFERLINDKTIFPKTAQPSPQDYIDMYTPHLQAGEDIISLTISSKLSGSYASSTIAVDMLKEEYPERTIIAIDSLNVCVGQGLILRELVKMRDAGYSISEAAAIAKKILETTRVYFTLDSLEYLKRGGRVGPTTALVGGILGLHPVLQIEDGQITQLDSVRGKKKVLSLMEEAIVDALQDEKNNINISIGHIQSEQEALVFQANTEAALDVKIANPITAIGAAIGAHAGPGALAFAYCKKFDTMQMKEGVVA
jgi:DegV family protein with EDD domain